MLTSTHRGSKCGAGRALGLVTSGNTGVQWMVVSHREAGSRRVRAEPDADREPRRGDVQQRVREDRRVWTCLSVILQAGTRRSQVTCWREAWGRTEEVPRGPALLQPRTAGPCRGHGRSGSRETGCRGALGGAGPPAPHCWGEGDREVTEGDGDTGEGVTEDKGGCGRGGKHPKNRKLK